MLIKKNVLRVYNNDFILCDCIAFQVVIDDMVGGLVYIATKYTFCMYKLYVRSGPFYDIVFG